MNASHRHSSEHEETALEQEETNLGSRLDGRTSKPKRGQKGSDNQNAMTGRKDMSFLSGSSDDDERVVVYEDDDDSTFASIDNGHDLLPPPPPPPDTKSNDNTAKKTATNNVESSTLVLDPSAQVTALNYVAEHRIFLSAILELLSQRDTYSGIEVDMNDPNTIKAGPLKKASHLRGHWKMKYVEIRKGLLSYYENVMANNKDVQEHLVRKNVPLHSNSCTLRKVKVQGLRKKSPARRDAAVFEIAVEGRPKKLFLANSREERQAWLDAIRDAMVGGSVVRGEVDVSHHVGRRRSAISPRSPYKKDLEYYVMVQSHVTMACTKEDYVGGLKEIAGQSINVPVHWIRERSERSSSDVGEKAFLEEETSVGVGQLFKDLQRDSVSINGELFRGDCSHGPEKIIGGLTRSILMLDKSFADQANAYPKSAVTESQALSYARDVLLAGNRTRSGGDSYFCVDTLCKNLELAVLCPSTAEAEPLTIVVEPDTELNKSAGSKELCGWLKTRSRPQKPLKKRYFVLSEGTLSYYEKAKPRPHGLRGQMVLSNATLVISEEASDMPSSSPRVVVSLIMNDGTKGRQLTFDKDENKLLLWAHSLEDCISRNPKRSTSLTKTVVNKIRRGLRDEMDGTPAKEAVGQGGGGGGSGATVGASNSVSLKEYAAKIGYGEEELEQHVTMLRAKSGKARSAVKISIRASTEYKICTTDPQGIEHEDTWAWIRASFLQSFSVTGGPNGRMKRGEETVQICVLDHAPETTQQTDPCEC